MPQYVLGVDKAIRPKTMQIVADVFQLPVEIPDGSVNKRLPSPAPLFPPGKKTKGATSGVSTKPSRLPRAQTIRVRERCRAQGSLCYLRLGTRYKVRRATADYWFIRLKRTWGCRKADMLVPSGVFAKDSEGEASMSTSLLYHAFGIRGYRYESTKFRQCKLNWLQPPHRVKLRSLG